MIIPRYYRLLFSILELCENTSLLPPTLLQPELIGPCAPSVHNVDIIFSRVPYDFFLCLLCGACVPRHFYLFPEDAAPLIISHIVRLSPDPPYFYKSWLPGMIVLIKERMNFNKLPLLARLILVVALFHVLGACRPANNSTPPTFFLYCWLAG